ncbi:uncharacterized protein ACR2FA_011279 [Aphomia sociella]
MKAGVFVLFVFCYAECRKTYAPIDKNANIAFINMEGGGGSQPAIKPQPAAPNGPAVPPKSPTGSQPNKPGSSNTPVQSATKPAAPTTTKPVVAPTPVPAKPTGQIKPVPVNPAPVAKPITTPGPGTVKQLVTFYDSHGNASPIRPYSYSQAVKQG